MRIDWDRYLPKDERAMALKLVVGWLLVTAAAAVPSQVNYLLASVPSTFDGYTAGAETIGGRAATAGVATLLAFFTLAVLLLRFRYPRSLWVVVAASALAGSFTQLLGSVASRFVFQATESGALSSSAGFALLGAVPELVAAILVAALVLRPPRMDEAFPPPERRLTWWIVGLPALSSLLAIVLTLPAAWEQTRSLVGSEAVSWATTASSGAGMVLAPFLAVLLALRIFGAPRSTWLAVAAPPIAGVAVAPISAIPVLLTGSKPIELTPLILGSMLFAAVLALVAFLGAVAAVRAPLAPVAVGVAVALVAVVGLAVIGARFPQQSGNPGDRQFPQAVREGFPGFESDAAAEPVEPDPATPEATTWLFTIERGGVTRAIFASDIGMDEEGLEFLTFETSGEDIYIRDDYFIDHPDSRYADTSFGRRRALWDAFTASRQTIADALPPPRPGVEVPPAPRQRTILGVIEDGASVEASGLADFGYGRQDVRGATLVVWSDYANEELAELWRGDELLEEGPEYVRQVNRDAFGGDDGYRFGVEAYRWVDGRWRHVPHAWESRQSAS